MKVKPWGKGKGGFETALTYHTNIQLWQQCTPIPVTTARICVTNPFSFSWEIGIVLWKKKWCFLPTCNFQKSYCAVPNWCRDKLHPVKPNSTLFLTETHLFCPLRASRCQETSFGKWRAAMAGGGQGALWLADQKLLPLWWVHKEGFQDNATSTPVSQGHLEILGEATGYNGFALCSGWRRKLGMEGG